MFHFFRLGLATILLLIFSASVFSQTDTTAPTVSSATVDRTALVITFDETLAPAANLANGAFTVKKTPSGGSEQTESLSGSPSISAATVTLTLADVVAHNDTGVKVSYTKPASGSNNKLQDAAANEVAGFTDRAVTNNTAQAPAPTNLAAGNTTGNYTNLTWDEPADDGNGAVGGYNVYRCAVADGDTTCTPAWIAWVQPNWHNYYADDDLSAGATYRYAVGSSRGDGTNSDWSNVVTVTTLSQAPAPTGLTVTATTTTSISLGWSAPADDGKGAITGYNVYSCEEGMTACTPVWVAWVDGASTTSYTHSSLTTGQEYRYAVGASRGDGTESVFSDQVTATAQAPDTTAPTFSSATVDGTALVITFNETLAPAASLANSAFTVKKTPSGGSEQTASLSGSPSISGATVTLTLAAAAVHTDTGVKVSYTKPASGSNNKLQDAADNEVAGFTDRAVTNETADPTAPAVSSATVDGTALVITFNETLAPAPNLANGAFTVKKTPAGGSEQTASLSGSPSISGATVTLTLAAAAVHTDTGVKVSYTKPASGSNNKLQDAADNEVADFTDRAVTNNTADTTAPTVSSATVDRTALVITFDETLAPAANLANGAFTVKKTPSGGSEQTESLSGSPSISAATVTLTLADVVAHNDTGVKVSYTKPASGSNNKLQDAAANEVAGFTDRAVTNNTAQAPAPTNLAAANTTGNYTNLTWDEPTDSNGAVGGYNVYRCAVADGDLTCTPVWLAWVMPNWHNYYEDSTLSAGATYRYAVGSSRGDGTNSAWSNVVTVTTLSQAPAPTGLTVTATTTTSISLGWSAPADDGKGAITGYNVYSCEEGVMACDPVFLAWVDGASTTSYTHSSLTTGQEYRYAVGASRGDGTESVFSDQVTATAQAPDTTAPTFSSATVDGTALVITFNETLAPAASLANSAFAVKKTPSGGSEQTASLSGSPSISGATVTLTLAAAAVHTDTGVKVSYTKPASGSNNKLQDAADNEVAGFTDRAVTNETADPTAPAVSSATVDGTALVITFNETLAPAPNLANGAFTVKKTPAGGSEQTASLSGSPSISGATVTLTLAAAAVHTDTGVKVSYTKPTSGSNNKLQDAADNEVADFTDRAVTNNTADTTAPTFSSATVDRTALVITFDETLAPAANLANGAFTVKKTPSGGSEQTESLSGSPSISAATVTLTLADVVAHNDTGVKVSYTKPASGSNNKLQDAAANEVAGFTDRAVTNNTAQAPAPTNLAAANTTGNYTNLTWDEPTDSNGAVGGYNVYRCAVADGDLTCTPVWLAWVMPNWHNYYEDSTLSAGATYRYAVGSSRGDGTNSAWSNVVTVTTLSQAPAPTGLTVTATTTTSISLGWSAPADDGKGAITGYNVYSCEEGMTACTPVWVAWVDGASTTSYTHSSLTTGQEYRYAVGASRGDGTESVFSDQVTATAQAPDTTAPTFSSATVDGTALVITFNETLAPAASLANSAFAVKKTPSGGSEQTASLSGSPSISGATVTLTLAAAAVHTDTGVKVSYTKPASGSNNKLQDAADNEVAGFTDRAVTNETADPTAPAVSSATVDGTALVITFNETLAPAPNLANGAFTVKKTPAGGSEQTASLSGSPSISGATVTLTLAAAAVHTDTGVKVSYTKPTSGSNNKLQDAADNEVADFTDRAVTNNTADTTAPTFSSATVDRTALVITFDETLAPAANLANGAFTVKKTPSGGSEQTESLSGSPSISAATVTLTLADVVAHNDTGVKVSYTKPASGSNNKLQDAAANEVAGFTDRAVTNNTAQAPAPTNLAAGNTTGNYTNLTWDEPADDGNGAVGGYNVYRCAVADGDTTCTPVWLAWVMPNWHNYYEDSTLSAGATYRYAVGSSRGDGTNSDWSNVVTVMTLPAGTLALTLDAIAGDNTVNIAEKEAGFSISGDTGSESGVSVSVTVGSQTPLTDTTDAGGNWSVDVPADASYITGASVTVTVSAAKTGYTAPGNITHNLTIDLGAPTAPTYSAPTSLTVGTAITNISPAGGSGIDGYRATGLPAGLSINSTTGIISGTPTTANAGTAGATVTAFDRAGNTDTVDITFPAVAEAGTDQTAKVVQAPAPPPPPIVIRVIGLKATAVSADSISLGWKLTVKDVMTTYSVYRCTVPEGESTCDPYDGLWLAALENTNIYTDTKVTPGETYRYAVAVEPYRREELSGAITVVAQMPQMPAAPTGLMVTEVDESSVRLRWTAPEDDGGGPVQSIDIYRCNVDRSPDCSEFLYLTSRNPALTEYKDNDVESDTTYRYAVAAYRSGDEVSPWSNQVTALADAGTTPPAEAVQAPAPTGLTVTSASATAISLSWTAPADDGHGALYGYNVFRCEEGETACEPQWIAWVDGGANTGYTDDGSADPNGTPVGLSAGSTYRYALGASRGQGTESAWSDQVTALADAGTTPPAEAVQAPAPTGLTVTSTSATAISLSWTAPADDGNGALYGYNVFRCEEGATACEPVWIAWVAGAATVTYTDDGSADPNGTPVGLSAGSTYRYALGASRGQGTESPWSDPVTATAETLTAPGVPTGLTVQATASKVVVSWSAPTPTGSGGLNGYTLYRGDGSGCSNLSALSLTIAADATTVDDTGVTDGSMYCYELTASSVRGGEGMRSASVTVTAVTLGKPTGLTVTAVSETSISLSWSAPADGGGGPLDGYNVYRCAGEDCVPDEASWLAWVTDVTAYTDDGSGARPLMVDTPYRYAVAASRAGGVSAWSDQVTALADAGTTPPAEAVQAPAPTGLTVTSASATAISLSWTAPADDGHGALYGYNVFRCEEGETACEPQWIAWVDGGANTGYTDDGSADPNGTPVGLSAGSTYRYALGASRGQGTESAWSNQVTATADAGTTPPAEAVQAPAPTGLTVTSASATAISLSWTAPADDGHGALYGYNVFRCEEGETACEPVWIAWVDGAAAVTYTDDGSADPDGTPVGLSAGSTYRYALGASRGQGTESAWSNQVTATAETLTAPGVPTGLTVQATASKVVVSWSAPTAAGSGGLNGYTLYRGDGSGCSNLSALSLTIAADATTVDDTGVTDGSMYCYELTASSVRGGEGMRSASVTVTAVTLGKPTGLTVTAVSETSISLSWSAPADGGGGPLDGYNVYRCAGEDCVPDEASWLAWVTDVTAYTDDGSGARPLTVDTPYRYAVAASRAGGVSAWSNQVMFTVSSPNSPPVADAGPDRTVNEGAQVRLDGSRSEDPDNRPNPLEYSWQQVKGQPVTLSDAASATPGFITPSGLTQDVQLEFILTVTDGSLTAEDSVAITVLFDRVGARHTALEQGIAAFGRSVAAETVDVFSGRFAALESPWRNRIKLGGRQLDLAASSSLSGALTQVVEWLGLPAPIRDSGDTALTGIPSDSGIAARDMADNYLKNTSWQGLESDWDVGRPNGSVPQPGGLGSRAISLRDLLSESDFQIALDEQDDSGLSDWTLWGRGGINRFKGRHEDGLDMEGDVFSGYLGLDFRWDRNTLLGIGVSHSQGEMDYRNALTGEGELDTTLTSIYNYLHYSPRVGLNLWGALGYGWGDAELIDGEVRSVKTDLTMWLSALGLRNELATAGNIDLAIKADAFGTWLQTDGKDTLLPETQADSSRLRLVLEGSTEWALAPDSRLTPSLELGARWDGGDAESGLGMELGGGLSYTNTRLRLSVDARGRYLLVHEESDYEEWGASLMARSGAGPGGEGLSLSLTPTWGQATSGVDRLWGNGQARRFGGLGPVNSRNSSWRPQRLELKLGYGLGTSQGLLAPFGELSMVEEDVGRLRLGTRLVTRNGWVWRLLGERRSGRGDETDYLIGVFASYGFGSAGGQGL